MKKCQLDMCVTGCVMESSRVAHITLTHDEPLPMMLPGQFVQVQVPDNGVLLRRPISLHDVDYTNNTLHLLVQTVGRGTKSIASVQANDRLNIILPLGNGFPQTEHSNILLVGGGIGIAPLLYLGRKLQSEGKNVTYLLGTRTASDMVRLQAYEDVARVFVTTEDGSAGERGFVTNHSLLAKEHFDHVMVCGPTPMMRAVAKWALSGNVQCHVSLENMMACGLGACLCCVQKMANGHNLCVCKDGPVFDIKDLAL